MAQATKKEEAVDIGGLAQAKNICPHVSNGCDIPENLSLSNPLCSAVDCYKTECWFCLNCHELFCGRYANKHMSIHYQESANKSHCIAMGINDLSFWCYACDSYLNHLTIKKIFKIYEIAHVAKHGEPIPSQLLAHTSFPSTNNNEDDDGDHTMSEYEQFINATDDYLDHSVNDTTHSQLMKAIETETKNVEWNQPLNIPDIDPILHKLNNRKLFVGNIKKKRNTNSNDPYDMLSQMFSSRSALSGYSLYDKIESKLKLQYIKSGIDRNKHLDRAIGAILGMGIGDATGAPLEFIPCVSQYKKAYFTLKGAKKWIQEQNAFSLKRGQWTDDASMGLCIADSLILNREYVGSDIRIRFWNWWNNGYCNAFRFDADSRKSSVGLGGNISKSIFSMKIGQIPTPEFISFTNKDDSGNGSIMRLAAIPVFFCHCLNNDCVQLMDIALEYAKKSSFTTHPGYIAAECCALMSYIIINAINRDRDDEKKNDDTEKDNVQTFLENITNGYLKRIEVEHSELKNTLEEMLKSKQFNEVKDRVEELSLKNKENKDNDDVLPNKDTLGKKLLGNDGKDDGMDEDVNESWYKIQNTLNHIHRQIIAKKYIMRLIKSQETDDSTERCWNWKEKYGDLGIDKTMINRGGNYNGYPNTQGYFGSYCMDGLAMGLHSLYNSTSFGDAIKKAVNMLGDADSTGSIAGQLAGAWYGFKDVFYDTNDEQFLFKQISKWDDYEFGLRGILLYSIGADFAKKALVHIQAKNSKDNQPQ